MGKKLGNYPFFLKGEMGNVLGGVLPEGDVNDAEKHDKIDTIGGDLKIEIKKAVKGHGHQTAQCADSHKKPKRIILQFDLFDPAEASY